jgi:hypothetical protein
MTEQPPSSDLRWGDFADVRDLHDRLADALDAAGVPLNARAIDVDADVRVIRVTRLLDDDGTQATVTAAAERPWWKVTLPLARRGPASLSWPLVVELLAGWLTGSRPAPKPAGKAMPDPATPPRGNPVLRALHVTTDIALIIEARFGVHADHAGATRHGASLDFYDIDPDQLEPIAEHLGLTDRSEHPSVGQIWWRGERDGTKVTLAHVSRSGGDL